MIILGLVHHCLGREQTVTAVGYLLLGGSFLVLLNTTIREIRHDTPGKCEIRLPLGNRASNETMRTLVSSGAHAVAEKKGPISTA